ncbi:Hypothetical protein CINCED_3A023866 [Cinara cedri]|uniref:Uncharacterized protein n=1 Tax=Cinara cedri TaxID=506608 RepID=A0A5E4MCD6_9HEMI|nr:Hypothetical protein CINCED_3A023866 [Cinara cedri]
MSAALFAAVEAELDCSCDCGKIPCSCCDSEPFYGPPPSSPSNVAARCGHPPPPSPCAPIPPLPTVQTLPYAPWPISSRHPTCCDPSPYPCPAPCARPPPFPCPVPSTLVPAYCPPQPSSCVPQPPPPPCSFPSSGTAGPVISPVPSLSAILEYLTQQPSAAPSCPPPVARSKLLSVPLKPLPSPCPCNSCSRHPGSPPQLADSSLGYLRRPPTFAPGCY